MLTEADVQEQIEAVKAAVAERDYPLAFSLEVSLWHDVLEAIADGAWDVQDLAKGALSTTSLRFPRRVA